MQAQKWENKLKTNTERKGYMGGGGLISKQKLVLQIRKHEDCAELEMNGMIGVCQNLHVVVHYVDDSVQIII